MAAQGNISHLGLYGLLAAMLPGDVVVTAQWLSRNQVHTAGMADKGHVVGVAMRYVCQLVPRVRKRPQPHQKDVKCLYVLLQRPSQEVQGFTEAAETTGFIFLLRSGE